MPRTVKVAVLGGGMAGVAAAWTLVHASNADVSYDVTIYEASWRLGGKCASGRNLDPALGMRIEEHGIHILLGFYSQVLRILRDCYGELNGAHGFPAFSDALEPGDRIQLPDWVGGKWTFWSLDFPTNGQTPGDADPQERDIVGAIANAARTLLGWLQSYEVRFARAPRLSARLSLAMPPAHLDRAAMLQSLPGLVPIIQSALTNAPPTSLLESDLTLRRLWMAIYFAGANLIGIIRDGLFTPQAYQSPVLNALDYKAWLQRQVPGLPSKDVTWDSPVVNAIYDLVFQHGVEFAAGVALYDSILMLLLYAGHLFYRMAGMGDVVFAPLYFRLQESGVHFRFQHVVTDVVVGAREPDGSRHVEEIALTGDGRERAEQELFVDVGGRPCWPSTPILDSTGGPKTLRRGTDFDYVISAIPIGAMQQSAPSLVEALPTVASAVAGITTIPTQSLQIWFDQDLAQMGWTGGRMMLGAFAGPFNSAADMAQCLPVERLPNERAVLYLSDVFNGTTSDPNVALPQVRADAIAWVEGSLPALLPGFTWDRMIDPQNRAGSARIDGQYLRANVTGTELYVASTPGTVALRPEADGSGVNNLLLASDWIRTEENAGCVEAAARSGVQAADALIQAAAVSQRTHKRRSAGSALYVQNDDDWAFPHPVQLRGATGRVFPFLGDAGALQALCNRFAIGGATIRPWRVPLVLVFGSASDDIVSLDPRYQGFGRLSEREVGVFVPVTVETAGPGGSSFLALLCPYLFVDNGATLVAGREIFGLPKELATFPAWPVDAGVPMPLSVTGLALENHGDLATQKPILVVTPLFGSAARRPVPGWDASTDLADLWSELTGAGSSAWLVALKQYHAIEDGTTACYRALVRCRIEPSVSSVSLDVGVWSLALPPHFFPTPSATLGLPNGAITLLSVAASLDFTLSLGEVVAS